MSKLCRISIVGLHFLLLTHITHSFVLLTANVEDVRKIARKFVSDSLAEKITDFIAKATATLAEEHENSKEKRAKESSQVSAENGMYNVEKTIHDKLNDIMKTKKETTDAPKTLNTEKKRREVEYTTLTSNKFKNAAPKLHGRSRYIEPVEKAKPTETSTTINVENNDKSLIEFMKNIESSIPSAPKAKRINNNKTKKRFKLLSAFDSNTIAARTGMPTVTVTDKANIDKKQEKYPGKKLSANLKRSMGRKISAGTESDTYDADTEYETEKAVNELNHYDIERNSNKNTETEGASVSVSEKDEYDDEINNIIPIDEKVVTRGSLVKEKELTDDTWWGKELTTPIQNDADVQAEGKSWF